MTDEIKLHSFSPPSGGLDTLRRNIHARRRRMQATASGLAVLAIVAILNWPDAVDRHDPEVRKDLRVRNGAALEIATGRKEVRFYWVMTTNPVPNRDPGTS